MRILFSSAKAYELPFYQEFFASLPEAPTFMAESLGKHNYAIAETYPLLFLFVNDHLDAEALERLHAKGLQAIFLRCAGYNNIDIDTARNLGIAVARVPAYSPESIAEFTMAMALNLNRKLHKSYNRTRDYDFRLDDLVGTNLYNKTVGILGTGQIGHLVARYMHSFGARVLAYDLVENAELKRLGVVYVGRDEILRDSDILSFHLPLNAQTQHFIHQGNVMKLKPGVKILNTGRGGLLEAKALILGLKAKHIGGIALDVYEEESGVFFSDFSAAGIEDEVLIRLLSFPNVLVSSHQAYLTEESLQSIADTSIYNLQTFLNQDRNTNFLT